VHPIYELSDRITESVARHHPDDATMEGVSGFEDLMPDLSPDGAMQELHDLRNHRAEVDALPAAEDSRSANAARAASEYLDIQISGLEHGDHTRNLNSIACPVQNLRTVFDVMDKETAEGWQAVASRLHSVPSAFAGYRESLEEGRARGDVVARRQVEAAAKEAAVYGGDDSPLRQLPGELAEARIGDSSLGERVEDGVTKAVAAYSELVDYLQSTYLGSARDVDAVGPEMYERKARQFLGASLDPEDTYAWGWSEVERLRREMERITPDIKPDAGLAEIITFLTTDPDRASKNRDEFVDVMSSRLERAVTDLDGSVFDIPEPIRRVEVKIAPPGGSLGAYYVSPSEDFSRPGSVWYSLDRSEERIPYFSQVSTNYHEGFPGHHLQEGIRRYMGDQLTRLEATMIWYSGFGEGWALYAEQLMLELGYYEKPEYVFGKLAEEMLRACRVVIDIGSHLGYSIPRDQPFHPGEAWTFETGVEMLTDYATQTRAYAESEMTRYLGWPAQAISYKVGERIILQLREEMRRRLGSEFDLTAFHAKILGAGAVGLDQVRDVVVEA
jgi:uncharacterized protein (DUF885 family)